LANNRKSVGGISALIAPCYHLKTGAKRGWLLPQLLSEPGLVTLNVAQLAKPEVLWVDASPAASSGFGASGFAMKGEVSFNRFQRVKNDQYHCQPASRVRSEGEARKSG